MFYFSYNDYEDCTKNGEVKNIIKVEDNQVKYRITNEVEENKENKLIACLNNKIKAKKIIEQYLNLTSKIKEEKLEKCNNLEFNIKEENIILYKIIEKEIYVIFKTILEKDINLPYEIFDYSIKIIKHWNQNENKKNLRHPIVIPIVIDVANKKANIDKNKTIRVTSYASNRIDLGYNVIGIEKLKNLLN